MKCKTCKDWLWCESCCDGSEYNPSLLKLIKEKIKDSIIKLLRL